MGEGEGAPRASEPNTAPAGDPAPVRRRHFTVLLAALSLLLVAGPLLRFLGAGRFGELKSILFAAVFMILLVSAALTVEASRREAWFVHALAGASIALRLAHLVIDSLPLAVANHLAAVGFLGFVIVLVMRELLQARRADGETIAAALCVYLLMGIFWSVAYSLVELVQPDSFRLPEGSLLKFGGDGSGLATYFSFVTLASLGYGDVTPASDVAQTMSVTEAMLGQVFLVVLVARLVGMNVAQNIKRG